MERASAEWMSFWGRTKQRWAEEGLENLPCCTFLAPTEECLTMYNWAVQILICTALWSLFSLRPDKNSLFSIVHIGNRPECTLFTFSSCQKCANWPLPVVAYHNQWMRVMQWVLENLRRYAAAAAFPGKRSKFSSKLYVSCFIQSLRLSLVAFQLWGVLEQLAPEFFLNYFFKTGDLSMVQLTQNMQKISKKWKKTPKMHWHHTTQMVMETLVTSG